jgi:hypothetical protein
MKTSRIVSASGAVLLSSAFLLGLTSSAHATEPLLPDLDYTVTLNLNSLVGNSNGPFSLDLQFVTGSGNISNTVKIYNFSFVGGTPTGAPDYTSGNETGSVATGGIVTLNNTASDNELAEAFTAGVTQIKFNVDETPNSEVVTSGTAIPDQFNVAILDNGTNNIPTTDPSGGNTLVSSDLGAPIGTIKTFSSLSPDGGVTVVAAVPEPMSGWLGLLAAGASVALLRLRRRQA